MLRHVFFDVGNTLTFADTGRTLAPLLEAGFLPSQEQLHAAERAAKRHLDATLAQNPGGRVDHDYWQIHHSHLVRDLGAPDALIPKLIASTRVSGHWNRVREGTRELLQELRRRGHRLGVISNSDGRIAAMLSEIGVGGLFDSVTDSGIVGHEKPHPAIFRTALDSLGALPESSVYVGDIYSVDYLGARAVGINAILMDVCGAYRNTSCQRIEALTELPPLLA